MLQTNQTFQRANTTSSVEWHLLRPTSLFTCWVLRYIQSPSDSKKSPRYCVQAPMQHWFFWWMSPLSERTPTLAMLAQEGEGVLTARAKAVPSPCCHLPPHLFTAPMQHSPITSHPLRPAPSGVQETVQEAQILLLRQIHFSLSPYPHVWSPAEDLREYFNT